MLVAKPFVRFDTRLSLSFIGDWVHRGGAVRGWSGIGSHMLERCMVGADFVRREERGVFRAAGAVSG